jgi:hypothetical protein
VLRTSPQELQRLLVIVKEEVAAAKAIGADTLVKRPSQLQELPSNARNTSSMNIEFEPCLRHVVIPLFGNNSPTCSRFNPMEPRSEVRDILEWLKLRRVRRILTLNVVDSFHAPHTEETIELAVKPFNVDILDWRRMDLSIDCLQEAAANVRTLSLYSSGNWAVLSHWSSSDGVGNLKKV